MLHNEQRNCVRALAAQVAEIARSQENAARARRWRDVNALRKPDRAPVWCNPVGAWQEILPDESLECEDRWLRSVEIEFRRILFKAGVGDDSIVEPYYQVPMRFGVTPSNTWGVNIAKHQPGIAGGAWAYDPPLKTESDFDNLRIPDFHYEQETTQRALAMADELLGDILPARLVCRTPLSATLGTDAADLRGLEQMMIDMIDRPHLMHRLMAYLRDCNLRAMDQVQEAGLLTPNNCGPMLCSDPIGETVDAKCRYANLWTLPNSQEFDQVSPSMWEEFCLAYQKPIIARYGLSGYGCCESLTRKIDGVLSIPNLRVFVCSAWTDLDTVIQKCGPRYTIMWRQKASEVVFANRPCDLRQGLQDGMRKLRGSYYQVVLRELQTLAGHPDRLHLWTRLAIEMAEKWS